MLQAGKLTSLSDVFDHIPNSIRFENGMGLPEELSYEDTSAEISELASKTNNHTSFIGDMLPVWSVDPIVDFVSKLRPLSTSYTPYQPERSQGTLVTHWIYQCALSSLTGFEAINTSLYDRSFAMFEAITCAIRTSNKPKKSCWPVRFSRMMLMYYTHYPKKQVSNFPLLSSTHIPDCSIIQILQIFPDNRINTPPSFSQVNSLGLLENTDLLTTFCSDNGIRSIAAIDPALLTSGGLKPPCSFGENGADFIIGDAQHLATNPSFGGPGLGLFGCRYNEKNKRDIRHTPGRFIGKGKDINGRDCFVMVLSTREQHIRKEKATSNVCSNQAFLASLAGANLLAKGDKGLSESLAFAMRAKDEFLESLKQLDKVEVAFPDSPALNELVLSLHCPVDEIIKEARKFDLHLGIDVSCRIGENSSQNLLKLTFTDLASAENLKVLITFFNEFFTAIPGKQRIHKLSDIDSYLRLESPSLPSFSNEEISHYFEKLAELNVSPDDGCYPLGSCTMKYNPLINDWAAGLEGFAQAHPQMPTEDAQGPLSVLFRIQEWFKKITGLPGVTTQPVAGAQGELVGLKMFQAYHRHNGEEFRRKILIPRSAHGTNFATAAMAGYPDGIVYLEASKDGTVDMDDFRKKLEEFGPNLCGVMITNPNTSGIFEKNFKLIADEVHNAGGLVYMDGANMNAIAGIVNLNSLGVDAVHNNLHKTWTIPHGGGGPGDAIVAVSEKLIDFLPGKQVIQKEDESFDVIVPRHSIGDFHRHWGNFGHKVRALTYL